ncbi:MAG: DEAD/DEAH box helicase, partial [Flavobacteriaceae bacterium]|nr:DEAD/DEAH box helicase [Flavobacteriaceae bacterium]
GGGRGGSSAPAVDTRAPLEVYHHKQTVVVPAGNMDTYTFGECPFISDAIKDAVKTNFGFERMTRVQHATIPHAAEGRDIVAKAQTGTGKTLAFLVPAIDRLAAQPVPKELQNGPVAHYPIRCLVLSPTRELTSQIATEAEGLLRPTGNKALDAKRPQLVSQMFYGGRPMGRDISAIKSTRIDIVVATPGRLLDHLKTTEGFARRFAHLQVFVLDEADQMLDMGFRPDLERIMNFLPSPDERQTLLFSATIPAEIITFAPQVLRRDFTVVSTTKDGPLAEPVHSSPLMPNPLESIRDDPLATASLVEQSYSIVPSSLLLEHMMREVRAEKAANRDSYKVMVFLPTARMAQLCAELLNAAGIESLEIHSRVSQAKRTKASDAFKVADVGIMCCSDVTARGMDYPSVSLVLQVGLPSDQQQYVHRLGRTGRA